MTEAMEFENKEKWTPKDLTQATSHMEVFRAKINSKFSLDLSEPFSPLIPFNGG